MQNWQNIVLREWRNTDDEEYAKNLFDLVTNESVGSQGKSIILLFCIFIGVLGVLSFLASLMNSYVEGNPSSLTIDFWFIIGGGVFGAFLGIVSLVRLDISWPQFLLRLTPKKIPRFLQSRLNKLNNFTLLNLYFFIFSIPMGVIISSLILNLTMAMGNIPDWATSGVVGFLFALLPVVVSFSGGMFLGYLLSNRFGLPIVLFCGFGLVLGDILVLNFAFYQSSAVSEAFNPHNYDFSFASLIQMLKGYIACGIAFSWFGSFIPDRQNPTLKDPISESDYEYIYTYRAWWSWWRRQPTAVELNTALNEASKEAAWGFRATWKSVLEKLKKRRNQKSSAAKLITQLQDKDWGERFMARQLLSILAQETEEQLVQIASHPLCGSCFVRYRTSQIPLSLTNFYTHYGCPVCREVDTFLDWPDPIVAILDTDMSAKQIQRDSVLYVNWLTHRSLFDFDSVEIIKATDEDVERFAVQVGNDTDENRKPKYKRMACVVASDCELSENTMRILRRIFGQVQHGKS